MAQYALGIEGTTYAVDAEKGEKYWCIECGAPVKIRVGKYLPYFYHPSASPQCHLYSKSEDHLLLQLQLQKFLPQGELEIETSFLKINRIADLSWARQKIVFEIQCSPLELGEAQSRILNYREIGYDVIWLLDDRIFNRRFIRPAEAWIRKRGAYYVKFRRDQAFSLYYDQFDIAIGSKRLKKSPPLKLDLSSPRKAPINGWPSKLPSCIKMRIPESRRYFRGDLLDRTIRSSHSPHYAFPITRWRFLEKEALRNHSFSFKKLFYNYIGRPYERLLLFLIKKIDTP